VKRLALALAAALLAAPPAPAQAQAAEGCAIGRAVVDDSGNRGVVVGAQGGSCLLRYQGGQMRSWVPWQKLRPAPPGLARAAAPAGAGRVAVLRPETADRLVFSADARGHVVLTAMVNGAPVSFLVDTGASLVFLTPEDARAAGLAPASLSFDRTVETGNGRVHAAIAVLREVRIGPLAVDQVPAAVIDSLPRSVLGMSFLRRLKGFAMRRGVLTLSW
jgi:aspartyl protease family protein